MRTYKEFQRRHLDLANHSDIIADMLTPPTAGHGQISTRSTIQNNGNQHRLYTPGAHRHVSRVHLEPGQ